MEILFCSIGVKVQLIYTYEDIRFGRKCMSRDSDERGIDEITYKEEYISKLLVLRRTFVCVVGVKDNRKWSIRLVVGSS